MKINQKLKHPVTWMMSVDVLFYATAYPIIACVVNKQLTVDYYAIPSLIAATCGSAIKCVGTEKSYQKMLYDKHFCAITVIDALIWVMYFTLWLFHIVPDRLYPIASAVMEVLTVELSHIIRSELRSQLFPRSEDLTEFQNAKSVIQRMMNAIGSIILIVTRISNIQYGKVIFMIAMIIDNILVIYVKRKYVKQ